VSESPPATAPDLEPTLGSAEPAVASSRPSLALVVGGMFFGGLVGAIVASQSVEEHTTLALVFAPAGIALGGLLAYALGKTSIRRRQTDRSLASFAETRGWRYFPRVPLHEDTPLLREGDRQRTGRGFSLTIDGASCFLYEHVKIAGAGSAQQETEYVVLRTPLELPRIWTRHILNCALLTPMLRPGLVGDVGSGAGLPGLVLAISRPDVDFVLIEPMERRVDWLRGEAERLGLTNTTVLRARAEACDEQDHPDVLSTEHAACAAGAEPLQSDIGSGWWVRRVGARGVSNQTAGPGWGAGRQSQCHTGSR